MSKRTSLVLITALVIMLPGCNVVANIAAKPAVTITSPPSGSTYLAGDTVAIQSSSADASGISRVDLSVDGAVVRTDTPPSPQTTFSVIQTWIAQPGAHTISVRAYNVSNMASDPVGISVSVASPGGGSTSSAVSSIPPGSSSSSVSSLPPGSSSSATSSLPPGSSSAASSSGVATPDLFVSEYELTPGTPTQGTNVHVRIGVYNQGTAAVTTPFKVEWWAGSNYPAAACSWTVNSLVAKGGIILECDKSDAWASWYAQITTRVKVDAANAVSESDEGNNIKDMNIQVQQASVGKPDLFVSEYALTPGTPTQGANVHVRIGVYNQGTAAVTTPFQVEWWAGSNYPAAACSWTVESLAAKGGRILECDDADSWASWYAQITTRVKVDPANAVSESDEGNNIKDMNVQVLQAVANKPDLFVSEYTLTPSAPTQGASTKVRVGVYNQGTAAVSTPFTVQWFAGSNYPAAACSWTVDSLAAKGGRILECERSDFWASWYANITTRVKVDSGNTVSESDEGNNIKDMDIQVKQAAPAGKPDVYVSAFSLNPNPPTHSANVHVSVTIYNNGSVATSVPFIVQWYAGSNYASPACQWTVDPPLAAHGGRVYQCDKTNAWASNYASITTRVKVDPTNAIGEDNEGNNIHDLVIKVN